MRVTLIAVFSLVAGTAFAQMNPSSPGSSATNPQETTSGQNKSQAGGMMSKADQEFVNQAAEANMADIKLGELGVKKGSTADVRRMAQMIIDDHKKVGDKLQSIATRENVSLPTQANAEQRATYDRLSAMSGTEFDRAFLDELKTSHDQAISLFQKESQSGSDPQLKSFAQSTLPSLRHHQQMVNRQVNKM